MINAYSVPINDKITFKKILKWGKMLYLGISGYYYKDWIGTIYPERTNTKTMTGIIQKKDIIIIIVILN